jgi:5-methylcytosine-specific restriction endonuclease McrA
MSKPRKCKKVECEVVFIKKTSLQSYCSPYCASKHKKPKIKKPIPQISDKRKAELNFYSRQRKRLIFEQLKKNMKTSCERCNKIGSVEIHHLIYRSEQPYHPEIHNTKNLTLVCRECHSFYHQKKSNRNEIVKERKLYLLFNHLPNE